MFIPILFLSVILGTVNAGALPGNAIRPRHQAPQFSAKAVLHDKFINVKLSDYAAKNMWSVLLFYPFDFTFVCPTEIISFSERNDEFHAINAQVLAISTDSHHTHLAWVRTPRSEGGY
jgi:alkyl hydroperoxide reductase subunit AhpC